MPVFSKKGLRLGPLGIDEAPLAKKMGSRKLILLPQVLSMLTLWGANRLFPRVPCFVRSNIPCFALPEGFARPGQIQPDSVWYLVLLCPARPPSLNSILANFFQTSQAKPDLARLLIARCLISILLIQFRPCGFLCI